VEALRTERSVQRRLLLALPLSGALLGVPLLALQSGAARSAAVVSAVEPTSYVFPLSGPLSEPAWELSKFTASVGASAPVLQPDPAPAVQAAPTTTSAPVTLAAAVHPTPTTVTLPPRPPTTTSPPPPPPTTTTAPIPQIHAIKSVNAQSGEATWYAQATPGYCASPNLPFGTIVRVTNRANGLSVACTVNDREADNPGRVIDLSYQDFSQIADPNEGIITVSVTW
jgi:hypothetical protein